MLEMVTMRLKLKTVQNVLVNVKFVQDIMILVFRVQDLELLHHHVDVQIDTMM